ncbi:hypothetical protein pdam_00020493 [Pocillopora damicornis]|uniref:Uncharacterized protein n=1 Tax=Pocillopora damicornis TaxID=46731 RepID=A0A3M6UFB5_POCDA|nr:hypothetical protein pdam_00020493 [Pocillopora damicornis]
MLVASTKKEIHKPSATITLSHCSAYHASYWKVLLVLNLILSSMTLTKHPLCSGDSLIHPTKTEVMFISKIPFIGPLKPIIYESE